MTCDRQTDGQTFFHNRLALYITNNFVSLCFVIVFFCVALLLMDPGSVQPRCLILLLLFYTTWVGAMKLPLAR